MERYMTVNEIVELVESTADCINAVVENPDYAADPKLTLTLQRALVALALLGAQAGEAVEPTLYSTQKGK